jgi:serine/threonine protein kinase
LTDPFGLAGVVLEGQYKVEQLVGEGGFSAVYRGLSLGLNEPVAVKCLKLPAALGTSLVDTFVQRFRDESRILYRLSQGNLHIVRSITAGTTQAPATGTLVPYMVLEWLEGMSLANDFANRKMQNARGRSLEEIVALFENAADALQFAHGQGVVHRDLNPGNIFLLKTPQGVRTKVLDFGVAKIMHDSTLGLGPRAQTMGAIRIFAPAYGAPEQFDDAIGPIGAWSDVYAFTLIMLEALSDKSVNDGTNLGEFLAMAVDPQRRPTPKSHGITVPDPVNAVLERGTRLDPRERFQTVGEMWRNFVAAVKQSGAMTGAPKPVAKDDKLSRTMPLGSVGLGAAIARQPPAAGKPAVATPAPPRPGSSPKIPTPLPPRAGNAPNLQQPAPPRRPSSPALGAVAVPAPPPRKDGTPAKTPGTIRMEAVAPPVAGRDSATIAAAAPPPMSKPKGQRVEEEDEVTRVRAPGQEDLEKMASASPPPPRPAAGAPPPESEPHPADDEMGGTLIMAPGKHPVVAPANFGQTVGLGTGGANAPFGNVGSAPPPSSPRGFAPPQNAPPMQQQQPQHMQQPLVDTRSSPVKPPQHMMPPMMQPGYGQHPHQRQQPGPPFGQPYVAQPAPAPAPNKMPMILGAVVAGFLLLAFGGGVLGFVALRGRAKAGPVASASASEMPLPVPVPMPTENASGDTPPPVTTETTPAPPVTAATTTTPPEEEDAAAAAPVPTTTAVANPTPTATAVANPTPENPTPPPAVTTAKPVADPNAWNEGTARARLNAQNSVMIICKKDGSVSGPGNATVTFAPEGTVTSVILEPPYLGTPQGDCAAGQFRRVKIPPYTGSPQTIRHFFEVPK